MSVQHDHADANESNDNLPKPREGVTYPLGYAQHCFWFVAATLGDTANNQSRIQIEGEIQPALLEEVMNELITHHPLLRSAISRRTPTHRIMPASGFDLPFADLTAVEPVQAQQQIEALSRHFLNTPFDLQKPPLLRVQLFRLQPHQFVLVICFPHIVADGAAVHLFCQQLWQRYRQRAEGGRMPPALQEAMPLTALIDRERVRYQQTGTRDRDFWRHHLQGYAWARFPTHYLNQSEIQPSDRYLAFPPESYEQLGKVARQQKVSLQMVLLTLIGQVVHKMTGESRFALNSVLEGRDRPGSETLLAPLLRVMPVPLDLEKAGSFSALLTQVRENVLSAYDHMDCPWSLPLGIMAEQRWRESPRFLPLLIRAASRLYTSFCPKAALYPHFLADFLFMEPQPPRALFRRSAPSAGIADPIINVNILQDAFRQQSSAGMENFLQLSVWQPAEVDSDQQEAGSWENDSINIYLACSAQGKPVLRITCTCFNHDGITQFIGLLQRELNSAASGALDDGHDYE